MAAWVTNVIGLGSTYPTCTAYLDTETRELMAPRKQIVFLHWNPIHVAAVDLLTIHSDGNDGSGASFRDGRQEELVSLHCHQVDITESGAQRRRNGCRSLRWWRLRQPTSRAGPGLPNSGRRCDLGRRTSFPIWPPETIWKKKPARWRGVPFSFLFCCTENGPVFGHVSPNHVMARKKKRSRGVRNLLSIQFPLCELFNGNFRVDVKFQNGSIDSTSFNVGMHNNSLILSLLWKHGSKLVQRWDELKNEWKSISYEKKVNEFYCHKIQLHPKIENKCEKCGRETLKIVSSAIGMKNQKIHTQKVTR